MIKINEEIRNLVILKRSQSVSFRMIAKDLNIGHSTMQYIWNKFLKTETAHDLPKSGRPHKCTVRERRLICHTSKKQLFLNAHEVTLTCDMVNTVSVDTVEVGISKIGNCLKQSLKSIQTSYGVYALRQMN